MDKPKSFHMIFCILLALVLAGCMPAGTQEPAANPPAMASLATPTPEIFRPLDPSPTPAESDLPLTCQVTDLNVFIDRAAGYCFAYPLPFTPGDGPKVLGPALDDSLEPLRASLEIDVHPVPVGADLHLMVDAFLSSIGSSDRPIERISLVLGGQPAVLLEPVPGLGSRRIILLLHGDDLLTLAFHPLDADAAARDLVDLYQTVTGSFAFLRAPDGTAGDWKTLTWTEFGETMSLSYAPVLAPWVVSRTAAAVPPSDQILFAEAHPANAEFVFYGYGGGRPYDLPLLPIDNRFAQVKVFRTEDFPDYDNGHPSGFSGQLAALQTLLAEGVDPARCEGPYLGEQEPLPYLPWINMAQTFCAQPEIVSFAGGRGVRYITQFSQDLGPTLARQVFYTFQGLTDDGRFYVAAFFPVTAGIFPVDPPPCPECSSPDYDPVQAFADALTGQLVQLNALSADAFMPGLALLDGLVGSIRIGE